jgi:hypothetical protein
MLSQDFLMEAHSLHAQLDFSSLIFQYLSPQKKESFNQEFCHMPYQIYINKDHNKNIYAAQQAANKNINLV